MYKNLDKRIYLSFLSFIDTLEPDDEIAFHVAFFSRPLKRILFEALKLIPFKLRLWHLVSVH
jgi:hypothetical protein